MPALPHNIERRLNPEMGGVTAGYRCWDASGRLWWINARRKGFGGSGRAYRWDALCRDSREWLSADSLAALGAKLATTGQAAA